jgi:hypothetical protein
MVRSAHAENSSRKSFTLEMSLQVGLQKPTGHVLAAVMNAESGAIASSKVPLQIAEGNAAVKCELASASWSK